MSENFFQSGSIERPGAESEHERETKVVLNFFRHSKKESDPTKTDEEIRLTKEGRVLADARGEELHPQPEVSIAYGSPKQRTQETAARIMLAGEGIGEDASLEDIEGMIAEQMKYGKKIVEDPKLGFDLSGPSGPEMLDAFKKGEYLPYLIHESDRRAIETNDGTSTTYLRQAGNVAEIVRKYIQVGKNFHRIAKDTDKYDTFGNQLERYMGTHQGIAECFVAKVLEKTNRVAERDDFLRSIGAGFGETKGIHIEIVDTGNERKMTLSYPMENEDGVEEQQSVTLTEDIIEKIIDERGKFELDVDGVGREDMERRFGEVVRPLDMLREAGLKPLEPLQDLEPGEITPENFIGTNMRAFENPDCPNAFLMMPHSGEYIPKNLHDRLTDAGKIGVAKIDAGTYRIGQSEKVPSMWSKISRIGGFDLNRAPLDQKDNPMAPGSLIWKETMSGKQLYRDGEEPTGEEVRYLSEKYHGNYYQKIVDIASMLSARRKQSGERILAIDLHSYPDPRSDHEDIAGVWKKYLTPEALDELKREAPLFVLSDRNGSSCDADIKEALARALESNFADYLTEEEREFLLSEMPSRNVVTLEKYLPAGGYNAQFANEQRKGEHPELNMLQIEMNEAAYVDIVDGLDDAHYDHEKLRIMQKLLEKSILDIDDLLKTPVGE